MTMWECTQKEPGPHALAAFQRLSVSCFTVCDNVYVWVHQHLFVYVCVCVCVCVCVHAHVLFEVWVYACRYGTNGLHDQGLGVLCSFTVFTLFHSVGFLEPFWSGWSDDEELLDLHLFMCGRFFFFFLLQKGIWTKEHVPATKRRSADWVYRNRRCDRAQSMVPERKRATAGVKNTFTIYPLFGCGKSQLRVDEGLK